MTIDSIWLLVTYILVFFAYTLGLHHGYKDAADIHDRLRKDKR
jgi:hypothetical protein